MSFVEQIVLHHLSKSGVFAGLQMKPERELATILNVSHHDVRQGLESVKNLGFIVRKHGSGTFVRKRNPVGIPESQLREFSEKSSVATACLFDFDTAAPSQFDPARELSLGLCMDFVEAKGGSSNAEILAGIRSRSSELGCAFQETLIVDAENKLLPLPAIVEHLRAMKVDGLIVSSKWKEYFNKALSMAFKKNVPLVCYTWPSTTEGDVSPLVQLNTDLALRRAIGLLAKEGYRSIAFVGLDAATSDFSRSAQVYHQACATANTIPSGFFAATAETPVESFREFLIRSKADSCYVGDDSLTGPTVRALLANDLIPGETFGLISHANNTSVSVAQSEISVMEFCPRELGRIAIDSLLAEIMTYGRRLSSLSLDAQWRPRRSHRRNLMSNRFANFLKSTT